VLSAAGRLTPASCIDSTVAGSVVTHVLTGCTGPEGRMLSGSITSTWMQDGVCLHVEHATTSFTIGARAATGSLGVTICRSGTTETRTRDLTFAASTKRDEPISLTGSWDIALDTSTGCATQSGTLSGEIGDRAIDRTDTELAWCTAAAKRAPLDEGESIAKLASGTLSLKTDAISIGLRIEFLGDGMIRVFDATGNAFIGGVDANGAVGLQPTF
jgi:hypothetical protein